MATTAKPLIVMLMGHLILACSGSSGSNASSPDSGAISPPPSDAGSSEDNPTATVDGSSLSGSDSGTSKVGADAGHPSNAQFVFGAYKDTGINMNWNTNVISTSVSGTATALATDLGANGAKAITLSFATGECGSENWAGVPGTTMATANLPLLTQASIQYVVSTGGAAGSFTCGTDSGMTTFLQRWASSDLVGIDFDIEAGQSMAVIDDLIKRIQVAHTTHPSLRFSLTLGTLAVSESGSSAATSLGSNAQDSLNTYGDEAMAAVKSTFGFTGDASTWPNYVTVNLMTMDYGSPSSGVCVVAGGMCEMGQSAIQAAYNLHDKWGVPYASIELTPMIGGNDATDEHFTLEDVDTVAEFAIAKGLGGIHYWSYDRDTDCPAGPASPTCNTMGASYAGPHGYLKRFLAAGLN